MQLSSLLTLALGAAAAVAAPLSGAVTVTDSLEVTARSPDDAHVDIAPTVYNPLPANPDGGPLEPCTDKKRFDRTVFAGPEGYNYMVYCDYTIDAPQLSHALAATNEVCTRECDKIWGCAGVNWSPEECELVAGGKDNLRASPGAVAYVQVWVHKRALTASSATAANDVVTHVDIAPTIYSHVPSNPDGAPLDACADKKRFDRTVFAGPGGYWYMVYCDFTIVAPILAQLIAATNEVCTRTCDKTAGCEGVNWYPTACELMDNANLVSAAGMTAYIRVWDDGKGKVAASGTDAADLSRTASVEVERGQR
ncbi:hypothetical protein LTR08_003930 [Meristemomyces frigidus]|nr:hypothetical protein LTR08_003930 [Meristemomyces frigidus]